MTEKDIEKIKNTCNKVLYTGLSVSDRRFYNEVLRLVYDNIDQQAEIKRLKAEKDEIIRKIGHARIDNIAPTDAKSTEVIYKHGVVDGLAYAQDIVNGKAGEQE